MLFEASLAGNPAGTGTYVRGLWSALRARPEVEIVPASFASASVTTLDTGRKGAIQRSRNSLRHLAYYVHALPREARRLNCDVIYCPSSLTPLRGSTPMLTTVFDMTPLDFSGTQDWMSGQYLAGMLRLGVRRAAGVCTISKAVGKEIQERFPRLPAPRIHVVYPGPNPDLLQAIPARPALPDRPFLLMVGTVEPRKNHLTVLRALAEHRRQRPQSPLLLVSAGPAGWRYDPVMRAVQDMELTDHVIWLGSIEPGALKWLYQHAQALLFPSLYEGFGLPVLEAMMLGCPVIAAAIPSVAEIVGEEGTLLEPTGVPAWTAALRTMEDHSRDPAAAAAAGRQAAHFTWDAAAQSAVNAITAVVGRAS